MKALDDVDQIPAASEELVEMFAEAVSDAVVLDE